MTEGNVALLSAATAEAAATESKLRTHLAESEEARVALELEKAAALDAAALGRR